MTTTRKFKVERFGEIREFDTHAEALRFILREGDMSRLWSWIDPRNLSRA